MSQQGLYRILTAVTGVCIVLALTWLAGCRKRSEPTAGPSNTTANPAPTGIVRPAGPGPTLNNIIAARKTWDLTLTSYIGKQAPDLTVTDLSGRTHTLSALKGKDVLVTVWATWCGPCRAKVPDLIELRKAIPESDLAILAISFVAPENTEQMIRQFAEQYKINYVVAGVHKKSIPVPYSAVNAIPAAFFIAKDGTLKLATLGVVPLTDMMAILKAPPVKGSLESLDNSGQ